MTATICRAVLTDAENIGPVQVKAWRETYRGILSDEWMANVSDDDH